MVNITSLKCSEVTKEHIAEGYVSALNNGQIIPTNAFGLLSGMSAFYSLPHSS